MDIKSPFFVIRNFISPLFVEKLRTRCINLHNEYGSNSRISRIRDDKLKNDILQPFLMEFDEIKQYYNLPDNSKISSLFYNTITQGEKKVSKLVSDNAIYKNGKWVKQNNHTLTVIIFLNDYNSSPPFDISYEIYGGKYQFPQYNFGFQPEQGTMVLYPSGPNFINNISCVDVGTCCYIQFFIDTDIEITYNSTNFPGTTQQWLERIP